MKIAILHTQYAKRGGSESYLFDLIYGLLKDRDEIDLYVYKKDNKLPVPQNCQVIHKNFFLTPRILKPFHFACWVEKSLMRQKYDLTISLARTKHNDISICGGNHAGYLKHMGKTPSFRDNKYTELEKQCFRSSRYVICHSRMMKNEIIHYYSLNEENVKLVYPHSNPDKFYYELRNHREEFARQYKINLKKMNFLFPSTGHKRKGFFELLEAFRGLPPERFELLMVGDRPKMSMPENVRFLGFVNNIEKLYISADYTIVPSKYEPFGLVVPESLACGTPVIVSKYTGAAELMTAEDGIILEDLSPQAIKNVLRNLFKGQFTIKPGFIEKNGLTIDNHIKQLKAIPARQHFMKAKTA